MVPTMRKEVWKPFFLVLFRLMQGFGAGAERNHDDLRQRVSAAQDQTPRSSSSTPPTWSRTSPSSRAFAQETSFSPARPAVWEWG